MMRPIPFTFRNMNQRYMLAKWMPFEEYAAQPFVQRDELMKYIDSICLVKIYSTYFGFSPMPIISSFSYEKSYLYFNISRP
ncbi:hypothetical protein CIPAW_05G193900 [Carya illinoinensis]|uniref:Uncharacterized protein n=1 Tax=Carya illinoinensis TaxID=32201 RepID=A0A8T1QK35_CARIL|nr:hypothetical protein CIPAW_05G193900 [Carya illinoinensis]